MRNYFDTIVEKTKNVIYVLIGCLLFSISVNCFTTPNFISPGGIVGIGQVISDFTGIPNGILCIILNIPIFIAGIIKFGFKSIFKNIFVALTMYVSIDATENLIPVYTGNQLMASILAGIIGGIGLAMIFITGTSTAGTGLLSIIINDYVPNINIGYIILFLDGFIVLTSAFIYGIKDCSFTLVGRKAIYAIILLYIQARLINEISQLKNKDLAIKKNIFFMLQKSNAVLCAIKESLKKRVKVKLLKQKRTYKDNSDTILVEKININY